MAIQDSTITLKGDQAAVGMLGILPQSDGSILLEVRGTVKDSAGEVHGLGVAQIKVQPGQVPVIDNMLARALTELRKANKLEV